VIKKLFLAHHSRYAAEVYYLATELQLRGIAPWMDKRGGFQVADESEAEARRAIREDCFGLLLYASRSAFRRWFITNVEVATALKVRIEAEQQGGTFDAFAVPRGITFSTLKRLSEETYGEDLTKFHSVGIPRKAGLSSAQDMRLFAAKCEQIAREVAGKVLRRAARVNGKGALSLQFSTRERMPDDLKDVLRIDATDLLANNAGSGAAWGRVLNGLRDVKELVGDVYGRPCIIVNGSKHLSAAFMFGRVFAPFPLDIRQTPTEIWSTDARSANARAFCATVLVADAPTSHPRRLFVEIATGYKNVAEGVDKVATEMSVRPNVRLQLQPEGWGRLPVDNGLCLALVDQAYAELEKVQRQYSCGELHVFAAAPQAFMMLLGQRMAGMPPVHLYEWTGAGYEPSCVVPGGVL
jgi:hypothetical protein